MTVKHERDIDWPDDTFTLPRETNFNGDPIKVCFEPNVVCHGGHYVIWLEKKDRGAPIKEGLGLDRAKREALKLQRKHGSPIIETVEVL